MTNTTDDRRAPALLKIWNADGSITLYSGGKKLVRLTGTFAYNDAKNWQTGWFGEGKPQRVRQIFKHSKRDAAAAGPFPIFEGSK